MNDTEQYVRRFGQVLHFAILRGAPGTDMQAQVLSKLLGSVPDSLSEAGGLDMALQAFWPLNPASAFEELIWVERYPDLAHWCEAETKAQRDPGWITNQVNLLRSGALADFYSEMQVDDSLQASPWLPRSGDALPMAAHWLQLRSATLLPNLTELPQVAADLQDVLANAGFADAAVTYYGAATGAGSDRNNASIWVNYPSLERMAAGLEFMAVESVGRAWRRRLLSCTGIEREWYLREAR